MTRNTKREFFFDCDCNQKAPHKRFVIDGIQMGSVFSKIAARNEARSQVYLDEETQARITTEINALSEDELPEYERIYLEELKSQLSSESSAVFNERARELVLESFVRQGIDPRDIEDVKNWFSEHPYDETAALEYYVSAFREEVLSFLWEQEISILVGNEAFTEEFARKLRVKLNMSNDGPDFPDSDAGSA